MDLPAVRAEVEVPRAGFDFVSDRIELAIVVTVGIDGRNFSKMASAERDRELVNDFINKQDCIGWRAANVQQVDQLLRRRQRLGDATVRTESGN